jgi:hypothetical protein
MTADTEILNISTEYPGICGDELETQEWQESQSKFTEVNEMVFPRLQHLNSWDLSGRKLFTWSGRMKWANRQIDFWYPVCSEK